MNVAPKIMTAIVRRVLSLRDDIKNASDSYIDDIIIDQSKVAVIDVIEHLAKFGLKVKEPGSFDSARVLGLLLYNKNGVRKWGRGNEVLICNLEKRLSRRELFSISGQLIGHYPVANWLRVACSFAKRFSSGSAWEDDVGETVRTIMTEIVERVRVDDPMRGQWHVQEGAAGILWCDASCLALGASLEINGDIVEDMSWMRKKQDASHINVAELDAVVKGLNMVIKWKVSSVLIKTDSATVLSWLSSLLTDSHRVRTHGSSEMLIHRRLQIIDELRQSYDLKITVELVPTNKNKADVLTRVKKTWLAWVKPLASVAVSLVDQIQACHKVHHFGVDKTLYFMRKQHPETTRKSVEEVVGKCVECRSIDPAPVRWDRGELGVLENWLRLAIDVTHYGGNSYLTCVDCGPSRFALWKEIKNENAETITKLCEQMFREFGPPKELLMDNGTSFRSRQMEVLCQDWGV